jgi:PAS domain S-box-containing protein
MPDPKLRVLLVEDDKVDQMAFERFITVGKLPYTHTIAGSIKEATACLKSEKFDIIVSDYLLGDGTTFDVLALSGDCPVIITTGSGDEEVAVKAMKAGAFDYLIKDPEGNYLKLLPLAIEKTLLRKRNEEKLRSYQKDLEIILDERTRELREEIQERKNAEKSIAEQFHYKEALNQLSTQAITERKIQKLFDKTVALVSQTLDVEFVKILELLPDGKELLLRSGVGWKKGSVGVATVPSDRTSQAGYTLFKKEPVIVTDLKTETRFQCAPLLADHAITSGISVMINGQEGPFGVLCAHTKRPRLFTQEETAFYESVSNILADAIARNRSVKSLRQSEERFRSVFESSHDAIIIANHKSIILSANKGAEKIFGYSNNELQGLPLVSLMPAEYQQDHMEGLKRVVDTGKSTYLGKTFEFRGLHKDGSEFPVELNVSHWFTNKGIFFSGILRDVTERRKAEDNLRESEERFRALAENTPDWVWEVDADARYTYASPKIKDILGYAPEETIGKTPFDFMQREEAERVGRKFLEIKNERRSFANLLNVNLHKDGHEVILETSGVPIFAGDELIGYRGMDRDITKRVQDKKELEKNHALLKNLIDSIPDLIYYKDKKSVYMGCNEAFADFAGRKGPSEIIGHTDFDFFPQEVAEFFRENDQQMLTEKKPRRNEEWVDYPDGRHVLLDILKTPYYNTEGKILGLIGISRDITARYRNEEQRKAEYERFQNILDSFDALVYIADMESYELLFVNKFGRETWGDIKGKICWQTLQEGQSGPCEFCTNKKLLDPDGKPAGVYVWEFQNTVTTDWFECRDQAITWDNGRYVRLEIATNINQRRNAEQEREKLQRQLRQAQKMEAIGTLAGGIAHDFNNMLVPILAYSEMLLESLPDSDQEKKHDLKEVLKAAKRARDLVKQILTFSRQTEHEHEPLLITPIIKESLKLLKASLPSNIETSFIFNADKSTILGEPTQVQQIVMNLCTNSYHAMRDNGGQLEVVLDEVEIDREDFLQNKQLEPGSYVKLSISDTGHGIEKQVLDRIFEPYFTTKKQGEGTGLGLSVVHGIVKKYGGDITVYSEIGRGTSMHVYLPTITAAEDTGELPQEVLPLPGGSEHILLVDDEEPIIQSTSHILESLGYKVTARTSSLEALEEFKNRCDAFDLVITDQTMPKMTGDRLSEEMLRIRPDIPIILCTGFSSTIDERRAKEIGIKEFLMKPFIRKDLATTIRLALEKK